MILALQGDLGTLRTTLQQRARRARAETQHRRRTQQGGDGIFADSLARAARHGSRAPSIDHGVAT